MVSLIIFLLLHPRTELLKHFRVTPDVVMHARPVKQFVQRQRKRSKKKMGPSQNL